MEAPEASSARRDQRFCVVVSRFNELVTERLVAGAVETLRAAGVDPANID
ncbi:MAG: 6,7-dimethyl-8-ribityllumazine synthase, partial [Gemmatimonadetes bacterium]|nr:6,7-dimethyl-8-ribityllumazine synthase [Gemmatimonadota bacterium]